MKKAIEDAGGTFDWARYRSMNGEQIMTALATNGIRFTFSKEATSAAAEKDVPEWVGSILDHMT
jgi:hypothetical protein